VVVTAAGNTIPVALDLSFRLNRFSVKSFASAIEEQCVNYVSNSGKDDLLVAISKSGMTVRILQIIDYAKKHGLKVLAITGDEDSSMARQADCVVNSGGSNTVFSNIQNGLETHIGEHLVIDALLIVLDGLQTDQDRKEEAEFEIASWKV
jgi:DNA-binding MurR/RpiR family transcriptional regulator